MSSPDEFARGDAFAVASIALGGLACVVVRSVATSITHDEALTYLGAMHGSVRQVLLFNVPGLPDNNHLLFTLLAKLSVKVFGLAEWSMRLPSMLAFVLYAAMMALLLRRQLKGALLWLLFAVAIFNPAVLEMMSIARGYGLGIALSMAATLCLLRGAEPGEPGRAWWWTAAAAGMAAATLAHLTFVLLLVLSMAIMIALQAAMVLRRATSNRASWRVLRGPLIVCLVVAPLLVRQVRVLAKAGLFATEGLVSFHHNTVQETIAYSLGGNPTLRWLPAMLVVCAYAIPAAGVLMAWAVRRSNAALSVPEKPSRQQDLPLVLVLLVGACVLSIAQHHIGGVAYLSGRRAVLLFPLFVLVCGALASSSPPAVTRLRRPLQWTVSALAVVLMGCFVRAVTLDRTVSWQFDTDTRAMMGDLQPLLASWTDAGPARLGIPWIFEPSVNFYRMLDHVTHLAAVDRSGAAGRYDFYYLKEVGAANSIPEWAAIEAAVGPLQVIKRYQRSGTVLARPFVATAPMATAATVERRPAAP